MALANLVDDAETERCPFPTTADVWTVIDDDVVIVAGQVRDRDAAQRVLGLAAGFFGPSAVLCDLDIDADARPGTGALVVVDSLAFDDDAALLSAEADDTLDVILAASERYDEALLWIAGGDDSIRSEHEAVELSRRRVAVIHDRVEGAGRVGATVRVELRDRDLTARSAVARRRYAVRISTV